MPVSRVSVARDWAVHITPASPSRKLVRLAIGSALAPIAGHGRADRRRQQQDPGGHCRGMRHLPSPFLAVLHVRPWWGRTLVLVIRRADQRRIASARNRVVDIARSGQRPRIEQWHRGLDRARQVAVVARLAIVDIALVAEQAVAKRRQWPFICTSVRDDAYRPAAALASAAIAAAGQRAAVDRASRDKGGRSRIR